MSDIDLDAIEARANAATPGPWHVVEFDAFGRWGIQPDGGGSTSNGPTAAFVANASTDIPALIARVREQEQEIARLRSALEEQHHATGQLWNEVNARRAAERAHVQVPRA